MVEPVPALQTTPQADKPAAAPAHPKGFISQLYADIIATVGSITIAGVTAWGGIESRAYKNSSSQGLWNDLKPERAKVGPAIYERALNGDISAKEGHNLLKNAILTGEDIADKRLKTLGSLKIWQQWDLLRNHQKREVMIATVAVGGIALGTTLLMIRGIFSQQQQAEINAKAEGTDPKTPIR
jgi:hypothetical protein